MRNQSAYDVRDSIPANAARRFVLVVDDDRFQCEEIVEYLNDNGIESYWENSPEMALQSIQRLRPGVVLCDINMPRLDGVELAKTLRNHAYTGELILMSGNPDAERRANQCHVDVFAVLPKPLPMAALERHILAVLRRISPEAASDPHATPDRCGMRNP